MSSVFLFLSFPDFVENDIKWRIYTLMKRRIKTKHIDRCHFEKVDRFSF